MRSKVRFLFIVFFSCLLVWGGVRVYYGLTDGFSLNEIRADFMNVPERNLLKQDNTPEIDTLLQKHYSYFAKGAQTYAFLSDDGKYVLKIVKQKHLRLPFWEQLLLQLPGLENYRQERLKKKEKMVKRLQKSIALSWKKLQKETALLYVHTIPTKHLPQELTIQDKLGFSYALDPNRLEFLIQRRAQLFIPYLEELIENNRVEEAKEAIQSVVDLLSYRARLGIVDRDLKLIDNIGFVEGKPIFIDIGRFDEDASVFSKKTFSKELRKGIQPLQKYFATNQEISSFLEAYVKDQHE